MNVSALNAISFAAVIAVSVQMSLGEPPSRVQTNTFQINLAYRTAALQKMAEEASWFSKQLNLETGHAITIPDIGSKFYIRPPRTGFGGVIRTTNFLFRFGAKLDEVLNRDKHDERFDLYPIWAKTPSLVDTNGAHQLATQWLNAVMVDVPAMEKKYKVSFYQWFYWGRQAGVPDGEWNQYPPTTNKVLMPIYDVKWGEGGNPPVKVTVFGPTKEMLVMELNDISLSRRPPIVISNWQELLNTPDPPVEQLRLPKLESRTNLPPTNKSESMPSPFRREVGHSTTNHAMRQ